MVELYFKATVTLQTAMRRNLLFPDIGTAYVYLGRHICTTLAVKLTQLMGNDSRETCHLFLLPQIKRGREKETNANCHWQSFVFKVQGTIQEHLKVPSNCLFINPVGGVAPSGTHVQRKMHCSGSIRSSQQVYFYPFMHKTTRT